ncbi:MAG: DUF3500 domain-containing protein [Verrucomicrobiales bacterium]|tara:strand:- start:98 stop:1156 length:1059 start_codon:yes stop_codon:yes gene_type:complete
MKNTPLVLSLLFLLIPYLSAAPVGKYPSLPSKVLSNYKPKIAGDRTPEFLAKSASTFLSSLNKELKSQAALPYNSKEKGKWTNVPPRGPQGGVRLGDLNESQIKKALDFLRTVLSEQGYNKAINIPLADDRLLRNGERRPGFGAEDYWLAIFGKPSTKKPWGLQFDGHHIAINLAFHGNRMSMSPTFIGTQPREFQLGDNKIIPMALEAPSGLKLHNSLNDEQKKKATIGSKRANLIAAAGRDGFVPDLIGISCKGFNEAQRKALFDVIKVYIGDLPQPFLKKRIEELTAEIDKMSFAWWGPAKEKGDFSYRLQGPSLIIEYAGQDLGGDPHDHLHSMYRDPTNEYGARLGK